MKLFNQKIHQIIFSLNGKPINMTNLAKISNTTPSYAHSVLKELFIRDIIKYSDGIKKTERIIKLTNKGNRIKELLSEAQRLYQQ